MLELSLVQKISIWVVPVLLGITVHEVMHGFVARKLGDNTAFMLGRLTLNPLKHVDPVGTILIPGLLVLLQAGFLFGYAKPVPINWRNLHHPKRDMALVAAAIMGVIAQRRMTGLADAACLRSVGIFDCQISTRCLVDGLTRCCRCHVFIHVGAYEALVVGGGEG